MRIDGVRVVNFRTLKDVTVKFDEVTTLIGPNGTGKSSVLRALDWFFNGGKAAVLTDDDCSFRNTSEPIEVEVTFRDLSSADREALGKYAPAGAQTFTAWKRRTQDGSEILSANAKGFPEFEKVKRARNATEKKNAYNELRSQRPELQLPQANTGPLVDQAMTEWEATNLDKLEDSPEELQTNFFGFNSGGVMGGLFDYVLVTADLRAGEEAQDAKTSIIGKILERSIDRSVADDEIAAIVERSRNEQQSVYNEKFSGQLATISARLSDLVSAYSPGREVVVSPNSVELKAPKTTFAVTVVDGAAETPVGHQGHGFQRTLLISALQLLAASSAASEEGTICFAIEEPELFQHPIQAQAFAKVLRALAEDGTKNVQVAYATHSPYFVDARHFEQIRRLTRADGVPPSISVHLGTTKGVQAALTGFIASDVVVRQLGGAIIGRLSNALFSERILLVEGTSDEALFYGLADRTSEGFLEVNGVSVVAVGGKSGMPLIHAICSTLGIPTYAVFDADSGYEYRALASGADSKKVATETRNLVNQNRNLARYFGLKEVDFPETQVGPRAAVFGDTLETLLDAEWPEWQASCLLVEQTIGVSLKKNHLAYRQATAKARGSAPSVLTNILSAVRSL